MEVPAGKGRSLILVYFIPYILRRKALSPLFFFIMVYLTFLNNSVAYSENTAKRNLHTYSLFFVTSLYSNCSHLIAAAGK